MYNKSMKTAILYYSHNLLNDKLLMKTLSSAIETSKENDCELIVVSHFPLTDKYEKTPLFNGRPYYRFENGKKDPMYRFLTELSVNTSGADVKSFVVGKMRYKLISIIKQFLFALEQTDADNIILWEHDCLYPKEYVDKAKIGLENSDLAYVYRRRTVVNSEGFFAGKNNLYYMSGFSAKRELFLDIFKVKERLFYEAENTKDFIFEPILPFLRLKANNEKGGKKYKSHRKPHPDDLVIESNFNLDDVLPEHHDILDIKHGLNQSGKKLCRTYSQSHPYWGSVKDYEEYMCFEGMSEKEMMRWGFGISEL